MKIPLKLEQFISFERRDSKKPGPYLSYQEQVIIFSFNGYTFHFNGTSIKSYRELQIFKLYNDIQALFYVLCEMDTLHKNGTFSKREIEEMPELRPGTRTFSYKSSFSMRRMEQYREYLESFVAYHKRDREENTSTFIPVDSTSITAKPEPKFVVEQDEIVATHVSNQLSPNISFSRLTYRKNAQEKTNTHNAITFKMYGITFAVIVIRSSAWELGCKDLDSFQQTDLYDLIMRLQLYVDILRQEVNVIQNPDILFSYHELTANRYVLVHQIGRLLTRLEDNPAVASFTLKEKQHDNTLGMPAVRNLEISSQEIGKQQFVVKPDKSHKLPGEYKPKFVQKLDLDEIEQLESTLPIRIQRTVNSISRNKSLSDQLKQLYQHTCQVCGTRVQVGLNEYMSESHHIHPVGGKHKGPDVSSNIIILCPNDHAMFDRGAITIDITTKTVIHIDRSHPLNGASLLLKHDIDERYVNYHNAQYPHFEFLNKSIEEQERRKAEVNFGKTVVIRDAEGEEHTFTLLQNNNRHIMNKFELQLLGVKQGETITYNGYRYEVLDIRG